MANKPTETERFKAELINTYNDAEKAKPGSGEAAVDRAVALQTRAGTAVQGKRYDQPNKDFEHKSAVYKLLNQDSLYGQAKQVIAKLEGKPKLTDKEQSKLTAARGYVTREYDRISKDLTGGTMPSATNAVAITPPADAISMLKNNASSEMQQYFDATFGPGAAKRALGG
jgi:hypothetical protein